MANLQRQSYDDNCHSPLLTEVLQSLPRLSAEELHEVAKYLAVLRPLTLPEADTGADWLLDGIIHEVRRRGLIGPNEHISLKTVRRIAPEYEAQSAHVRARLLKGLGRDSKPTPAALKSMGRMAAKSLFNALNYETRRAPLGLKSMLSHVSETLAAVNQSFPGYLMSGILWMVASSE